MGIEKNNIQIANYKQILGMDGINMVTYLSENLFLSTIPIIQNADDLLTAGEQIKKLSSSISFLHTLYAHAIIYKREAKRILTKEQGEDMSDKKDAIHELINALDEEKTGLSRLMTAYTESLKEINTSDGRQFYK